MGDSDGERIDSPEGLEGAEEVQGNSSKGDEEWRVSDTSVIFPGFGGEGLKEGEGEGVIEIGMGDGAEKL